MQYADFSHGYVLRLDQGEKFHESLLKFFKQKRFASAFYQGIGALSDIDLGFFDTQKNTYLKHHLPEMHELISAMGNLSLVDGHPFPHTHVTLGDRSYKTLGGHLFEATVAVTAEIYFTPIDIALLRKPNKTFDFKELDLPHHFTFL